LDRENAEAQIPISDQTDEISEGESEKELA
jgi:hypothetical protein